MNKSAMFSRQDRLAGQSVPALRDQVPLEEEEEERDDDNDKTTSSFGDEQREANSEQQALTRESTFDSSREGSFNRRRSLGKWSALTPLVLADDRFKTDQPVNDGPEHDEIEDELNPPKNFAMVYQGVFRSAYPTKKNFDFLRKLRLKSVVYLCQEEYSGQVKQFYDQNNVTVYCHGVSGNKEPFVEISEDQIYTALQVLLDESKHPVLIHCNQGKHRTGSLVGCLRAMNHWSMAAIFEEYRRFAGSKARRADMQFIELFHRKFPQVKTNPKSHPPWFLG
mmetsp:Transcript_36660/g.75157  ORF Transcript_36660/g.75157 Transcript_36660/m.75157 type:complete len:280 (+) Transcript_36660:100-939(+)|eukprot:CAMPEP_0181296642 /NCGR_PEP_ID=MMETSP1101-20121128/4813_1 /TAXON_ID=46948 /ORGANISM="Rhodomonas abbreviata, Strain Caron Lab Isolate" /LENGTH=279 /DNA_ID=CAMNT_0023401521 /DNA_START=99 /DNA_END=938 /DNA_ORIENTATION=+